MDLIDLFWNWSQSNRIAELRSEVNRLRDTARAAGPDPRLAELSELRAQNGELRLYVAVLLRILVAKGLVTREELEKLADQIDAEDGRRDNAYTGAKLL
ncbi:MAG: hypothetical protein U0797_03740 [Gemmataceae bacterium]